MPFLKIYHEKQIVAIRVQNTEKMRREGFPKVICSGAFLARPLKPQTLLMCRPFAHSAATGG